MLLLNFLQKIIGCKDTVKWWHLYIHPKDSQPLFIYCIKSRVEEEAAATCTHPTNANMADRSVGARNELHESEASEALSCFILIWCTFFRPP